MNTSEKELTKLLLKGCSCDNCFHRASEKSKSDLEWCPMAKKRPGKDICTKWEGKLEEVLNLFKSFDEWDNLGLADSSLERIYPATKGLNKIFKILSSKEKE